MIVFPKYVKLIKFYVKCLQKEVRNESTQVVLFQKHGSGYLRPSNWIPNYEKTKTQNISRKNICNIHILS